jgi:hypothetical protein
LVFLEKTAAMLSKKNPRRKKIIGKLSTHCAKVVHRAARVPKNFRGAPPQSR